MHVQDLIARLDRAQQTGPTTWTARCPAHPDNQPSLSVSEGNKGGIVICCHAGCDTQAIVAALNLTMADLAPPDETPKQASQLGPPVASYPYVDEAGELLYTVHRYTPKTFRQQRANGNWYLGDVRRVLYRLPAVLAAIEAGAPIYITEGEKDADTLTRHGLCATTFVGGAGKIERTPDGIQTLCKARRCVVVADADPTGLEHAEALRDALRAAGCDETAVFIPVKGKDATDALETHGLPIDAAFQPLEHQPRTWEEKLAAAALDEAGLATLPDPSWLIDGWLPANELTAIYGPPKQGKTFLMLDQALTVASTMRHWHGQPVRNGHVVYLIGEGAAGFKGRVAAWRNARGYDGPLDIRFVPIRAASFRAPEFVEALDTFVDEAGAVLVVADTFARFSGAMRENAPEEMQAMVDGLERVSRDDRAMVAVHHEGKTHGMGLRGHSALRGAVYFSVQVELDPTTHPAKVYATVVDAKDTEAGSRVGFELRNGTDTTSAALYEPQFGAYRASTAAAAIGTTITRESIEVVALLGGDGEPFRTAAFAQAMEVERRTANRILQSLAEANVIDREVSEAGSTHHVTEHGMGLLSELGLA